MKKAGYDFLIPFAIVGMMLALRFILPGNKGFFLQVIMYTIYVMGNNILMGYMSYVSFGQPIYLSIGGYAAGIYLFYYGSNPLIAFALAVFSGLVVGP